MLRTTEMNNRLKKLKWLRRGGAKAKNVKNAARASPVAAGLYGVAIQGVAPGQLHGRRCRLVQSLIRCPKTAHKSVVGVLHPDVGESEYGCDLHKRTFAMWQKLCMHPKTSEFRVGAALVTQCHRILKAVSPWASATGP
eukprot:1068998-Amphidinium_carterae.1